MSAKGVGGVRACNDVTFFLVLWCKGWDASTYHK